MSDDFTPQTDSTLPEPSSSPPPNPPPTPPPTYQPTQYSPQPYPAQAAYYPAARPVKDRSLAVILEVLLGLFGFLGIGWIYAGETSRGLITLVGYLIWLFIYGILLAFTVGLACVCFPINIIIIAASAYALNNYTKTRPDLFGP